MKFIIILLFVTGVQLQAKSYGQQVTMEGQNISIVQVFNQIHKQTGYQFVYDYSLIKNAKKVNVAFTNTPLKKVLDYCFKGQPFTYKILNKAVIVVKKPTPQKTPEKPEVKKPAHEIEGKITEAQTGTPLPGASVALVKGGKGTITDGNGKFSLTIPGDKSSVILRVSFLGYQTKEVKVDFSKSFLDIKLSVANTGLDEVVVTGYMTQKKRNITGAISAINGADIQDMPVQSFDQAMQGRMAGVLVQGGSGVPGGPVKVTIRGEGSITAGTEPLYIVDGVPVNSDGGPSNLMASNPLSYLDPSDIKSIEVLKDAAAASVYGANAGNGVVLITTKEGEAGKTKFFVHYYHGITSPMPSIKVLSTQEYLRGRMEAVQNANPTYTPAKIRTEVLRQNRMPINLTDKQIAALPSYDWQGAAFTQQSADNVYVRASGGSKHTTFRLTAGLNKTGGTVIGNDFLRGNAYLRVKHDISKKLSLFGSVYMSMIERNGSYRSWGSYAYFSSPQYTAPMMMPYIPIYLPDGSFNAPAGDKFPGNEPYNAIQVTDVNTQQSLTRNLSTTFRLEYNILPHLTLNSRAHMYYRFYDTKWYIDPRTQEGYARKGYRSVRYQSSSHFTTSHTLTYDHRFMGGHHIKGLLGVEYSRYVRQRLNANGEGFASYSLRTLGSAATILDARENWTSHKYGGIFGKVNYDYLSRYMLSATLRYDGDSRFGKHNPFGWFPAVSVGWDISGENFLRYKNWVKQLKLRASYGVTGNSRIRNLASMSLWSGSSASGYGGNPGLTMYRIANDDLKWEKNVEADIGLDYSFFDGRVKGAFDVYHRRSADLLLQVPLPWTSGYANFYRNVGEVVNKGLEITISTENIKKKDFKWVTDFNISFQRNKVTKLYKEFTENGEEKELKSLPGAPSIHVGSPLHRNFYSQYAGVNPANGRPMFWYGTDKLSYLPGVQGSGSYTPYGRGNRLSDYYGGLKNTFTYKRWQFDFFFQYDMGRELYNKSNTRWYPTGDYQRNTIQRAYEKRWTEPGQITAFPRPIDGGAEILGAEANRSSSRFLEDASYIRLKEISLKYKMPRRWVRKIGLTNMTLYVDCVNILTFTKWTGYDPEFYINDSNFGSNTGQIPPSRSYTTGIRINF